MRVQTWAAIAACVLTASKLPAANAAADERSAFAVESAAIELRVDASDVAHRLLRVHETLPVRPGRLKLWFPRWIPAYHGPIGDVARVAGLLIQAGSQRLAWRRDTGDTHAFVVDIPPGVDTLEIDFQSLQSADQTKLEIGITARVIDLQWHAAVLYPAGPPASAIRIQPSVKLPSGWGFGSALRSPPAPGTTRSGDGWTRFEAVSLETLIDSPVIAGRTMRSVALEEPGSPRPVVLQLFGDDSDAIDIKPDQIDAHRRLVQQADRLFGARHFRHYDLLLVVSREAGRTGIEHHESSENGVGIDYFKDWDKAIRERELLPHEFVHSWNGKFRRPADLWTPNYNVPMGDSLLWVYEGLTEYWGYVLSARSGLVTLDQARDRWARLAAHYERLPGRTWRSLQETTNDPRIASQRPWPWPDWLHAYDYYSESALLIWLDADTLIREMSGGTRSLDDFARRFFGVDDGRVEPLLYSFDDVVAAMNAVQPHDWARFFRERLDRTTDQPVALDGLTRAGWSLAYDSQQSEFEKSDHGPDETQQLLTESLGLTVSGNENRLADVVWDGPAFRAGLANGMQLLAVGMEAYRPERLAAAVNANNDGARPIDLLVKDGDWYRHVSLDVRGGLRFAKLTRAAGVPDRLGDILAPR